MATLLTTALTVLALISLGLVLLFHGTAHWLIARPRRSPRARLPISVLKPLCGVEQDLHANLSACARQDYPYFELVLGTEDPEDPALEVARRVARENPMVPMTVVTGAPSPGLNPKVNNLAHLARHARHDLLLISDADVRPGPGYLDAMMAEAEDPSVALVSSLLAGCGEQNTGAAWENLHLASLAAASVAAAHTLAGHPLVVGKSMLFRRSDLEGIGGWSRVENVLAEDYLLGQAFAAAGWKVALSTYPLPVVNRRRTVHSFVRRHLRWSQMRWRINAPAYLGELLLLPVLWATLAVFAAIVAPGTATGTAAVAVAVVAIKGLADGFLVARLRGGGFPLGAHWGPIKDLLVAVMWPLGVVLDEVDWRGHPLVIGPGSRLSRPAPRRTGHAIEEVES